MEAKETFTIRPGKEFPDLINKLSKEAKKQKRTLNNYVLVLIDGALKEKNAKQRNN